MTDFKGEDVLNRIKLRYRPHIVYELVNDKELILESTSIQEDEDEVKKKNIGTLVFKWMALDHVRFYWVTEKPIEHLKRREACVFCSTRFKEVLKREKKCTVVELSGGCELLMAQIK